MKLFKAISFSISLLLLSLHCIAQQPDPSGNTIHVKKKVRAYPAEIGSRFFSLYCREELDSLMMEFFPTKEIAMEFCKEGNATSPDNKLYQYVQNNFDGMKSNFLFLMSRNIEMDKGQRIPHDAMKIDSVTFDYPDSETWKAGTEWRLLSLTIHATAGKNKYQFLIDPLYGYLDRWYVFSTNYGFENKP